MILRLALVLLTLFLSLLISADRPANNCSEAWTPTANPITVESGMGVNIHFTDPKPGEIKMIAAAGFRWVLGGQRVAAGIAAALIGALIFSAFHYVGEYGDKLELASKISTGESM